MALFHLAASVSGSCHRHISLKYLNTVEPSSSFLVTCFSFADQWKWLSCVICLLVKRLCGGHVIKVTCPSCAAPEITHSPLPIVSIFAAVLSQPACLHHWPSIKMDDTSPLPHTVQKWSQNIPDMSTATLCWRRHLEPESVERWSGLELQHREPTCTSSRLNLLSIMTGKPFFYHQTMN